ncbi:MAG: glycerate kinase [Clostridiales bacterium]|nr:glycerate kinase [Clostridiales bacterium]
MDIKSDALGIINSAIESALPDSAVRKALENEPPAKGKMVLVSIGKASWQMAKTAKDVLGEKITDGVVITKYDHSMGEIPGIRIFEAGHPIPDSNSFNATREAINLVEGLNPEDKVIFLVSGGGSALFEDSVLSEEELADVNHQLLASGANIVEINIIRKRLSRVKAGRFAQLCEPATVLSIVLSDIIGDPLDMIASGPAFPDTSTSKQAIEIMNRYGITLSKEAIELLESETPTEIRNVKTKITGSVNQLCQAAKGKCIELGYDPTILTTSLSCEAAEAGRFLGAIASYYKDTDKSVAFIAGGETVVHLQGQGKGGRNQELALASSIEIAGLDNVAIFSVGSDGTDGPTDAAGGYVDGKTAVQLAEKNIDVYDVLKNNDSYHALEKVDGLIKTGPTGTNVNDVSVVLVRAKKNRSESR